MNILNNLFGKSDKQTKLIVIDGSSNLNIVGGKIFINGVDMTEQVGMVDQKFNYVIEVKGDVGELKTDASVTCENVTGNVDAGGSVTCSNIHGHAEAGGSITCSNIESHARAGGSISAAVIGGNASAGGSVRKG